MSRATGAKVEILPDAPLALLGVALMLVGLVAISSASIEYADWHYQNPWFHTQRHLVYLLLALGGAVLVYRVPTRFWLDTGWVWLFVALALLGFSFGALLVIYPPLTGGAFGTSNIGVNYGIMFLGYAASTWISQPITAVLYHAEAGSAAYQQSFYGAIVIAAIAVVLTVYMMVSDSKKKSA